MSTTDLLSGPDSNSGEVAPRSSDALFSPMQIASATLLGGVLAAGLLMAINYCRLGRLAAAAAMAALGVLGTVGQLLVLFDLPHGFPVVSLYLPMMLAAFALAHWLQGDDYADQLAAGGLTATNREPVFLSLLCLAATAAMGFSLGG